MEIKNFSKHTGDIWPQSNPLIDHWPQRSPPPPSAVGLRGKQASWCWSGHVPEVRTAWWVTCTRLEHRSQRERKRLTEGFVFVFCFADYQWNREERVVTGVWLQGSSPWIPHRVPSARSCSLSVIIWDWWKLHHIWIWVMWGQRSNMMIQEFISHKRNVFIVYPLISEGSIMYSILLLLLSYLT